MAREIKHFSNETLEYLKSSFKKVNVDDAEFVKLFQWLPTTPKWSTIRVNRNAVLDTTEAVREIQSYLDQLYSQLNQRLNEEEKIQNVPKCQVLSDLIDECVVFNSSTVSNLTSQKKTKLVIIDLKCAQAVFRGADIFIPGIISLSPNARQNDEISIFADLTAKCLKGSDANVYANNNPDSLYFVGNGWLMFDRDFIFKNSNELKSGVGVKIKVLKDNYYIPSLNTLDEAKFYLQNLPSIVCGRVLDPRRGETILDICAAPGGKSTHLAELTKGQSRIVAFDKIANKIKHMKELCAKLGANVECFCQDATKLDFKIYHPNSFDRILADVPCSALGQRPLIYNDITINQLKSYVGYQRMILEKAVELLKPGGVLVYSTCTITIEENEEQVSWLLNKFKQLELTSQNPFYLAPRRGFKCEGLNDEQASLLQRFMPNFSSSSPDEDLTQPFADTNGFFIAKFVKGYY